MGTVILWVLLSLVPAGVASSRGRSGPALFLASLVLSPLVGLVIALFLKPQSALDEGAARNGASRTHWVCPFCAEVVNRNATLCRHCGKALPAPPPLAKDHTLAIVGVLILLAALLYAFSK